MKTLGIIGGMSSFSTSIYYQSINEKINNQLGGSNSAKILLYSVNFSDFRALLEKNDWDGIENMLSDIAQRLENAGADCILIATNTPHHIADILSQKIKIPLLHIAEETAKEIAKQKICKVGLIGTKFTMENSFFKDRLNMFGIETIITDDSDRDFVHTAIFSELSKGILKDETRIKYTEIIEKLKLKGAEGIILGCTEIFLLIKQENTSIKVFDTTAIHINAAVDFALS